MMATWAPIVFWVLLVPLLIVMLIVYLRSKQFFRLVYIISIFTYAMTIMYWIDAFRLGRNAIIGLLVLSSILMILIGYSMRKTVVKKISGKNLKIAVTSMVLIAIIVLLSSLPIGWNVSSQAASSVKLSDVYRVSIRGEPAYQGPAVPVYSVSVTSTFMPRQYELPRASACLYNSQLRAATDVPVKWDRPQRYEGLTGFNNVEVFKETQTATLSVMPHTQWKPRPDEPPVPVREPETDVYDQLLVFLQEARPYYYVECFNLQPQDFEKAILIPITQN